MSTSTRCTIAAASGCFAELITTPFSVLIVRLQLQTQHRSSVMSTLRTITADEGLSVFYRGAVPAMGRTCLISGLGVGLYPTVRTLFVGRDRDPRLWQRFVVGASTGCFAQVCASPFDVVKVRMQAGKKEGERRGTSMRGELRAIMQQDGLKGYFRGLSPSLVRAVIQYGCTIGTYDATKASLVHKWGLPDGVVAHFLSSMLSGVITALAGRTLTISLTLTLTLTLASPSVSHDIPKTLIYHDPSQHASRNSIHSQSTLTLIMVRDTGRCCQDEDDCTGIWEDTKDIC